VTNVGLSTDLEYSVAKQDVCDWLTLDKSGSAGPIAPGNSDVVTGSIDGTGLGIGTYTCTLVFTNDVCTALPLERRTVTLSVLGTVWEYLGDVDPTDAGSAGLGLSFLVEEGVIQGAVEDDAQAVDGKVWRIQDTADAKTKFRSQPDTIIAGEVGATIVARVRVRSQSGGRELALGIWDLEPTYDTAEYFYSGDEGAGAGTVEEIRRGVSNPVTGDDQFHVLRLTVEGTSVDDRTIKLYFDEDPTPVVSITNAAGRTAGGTISDEGFAFGAGSTSGTMDIAFDCVAATNAGAFAPGAEPDCLGYRLCPLCPMPFADADQDGDVDHADFAAFQACYTGLNDPGSAYDAQKCHCFDRDNDQDVDEADLGEFEACATGADVLFDPEFPPEGCHP